MNMRNAPVCPYCRRTAVLRRAEDIHGGNAGPGNLYVCPGYPQCDSYVGVHKDTTIPLGSLANAQLRQKRREAHVAFDRLWKSGNMSRDEAYRWLRGIFHLTPAKAHIARFSESMCNTLVMLCRMSMSTNRKHTA